MQPGQDTDGIEARVISEQIPAAHRPIETVAISGPIVLADGELSSVMKCWIVGAIIGLVGGVGCAYVQMKYDSFMKTGRVKFRGRQQRFI